MAEEKAGSNQERGAKVEPPELVRKITVTNDPGALRADLEVLRKRAFDEGAARATIITAQDVSFLDLPDDGTVNEYTSAHWPLDWPLDDARAAIEAFQYGILFQIEVPAGVPDYGNGHINDAGHREIYKDTYRLVTTIESGAFYMGHHLALGFGTGNCRGIFCHDQKRCWASVKGNVCLFPGKARPSMLSIGLDGPGMADKLGWLTEEYKYSSFVGGVVMIT